MHSTVKTLSDFNGLTVCCHVPTIGAILSGGYATRAGPWGGGSAAVSLAPRPNLDADRLRQRGSSGSCPECSLSGRSNGQGGPPGALGGRRPLLRHHRPLCRRR